MSREDKCLKCGRAGHCSDSCTRPYAQRGFAQVLLLKVLVAVVVAAGAVVLYQRHAEGLREEGRKEVRAENAARAIEQFRANERESARRLAEQEGAQREHEAQLARARGDAVAAAAAADRMSAQLRRFLAASKLRPADSAPAGGSPPADDPIGVLADVLSRADARAGILAEYADRARLAGELCTKAYDSLTRSNGAAVVQPSLGVEVHGMSGLGGVVLPEVQAQGVAGEHGADVRSKLPVSSPRHAEEAGQVVRLGRPQVLVVQRDRGKPKVLDPVVVGVPVDVVQRTSRPFSVHVQPSEPVRLVRLSIDADAPVSVEHRADAATGGPPADHRTFAGEGASRGVVIEQFAQARGSKIGSSHEALRLRIGQRPVGVSRTARASPFSDELAHAASDALTVKP